MGFIEVVAIVYTILCVISFFYEKNTTGYYKVIGVYGRIYAYFSVALIGTPLYAMIMLMSSTKTEETDSSNTMGKIIFIAGAAVFFAIGVLLYVRVYKKSPDFFKKRCLIDLTVSGMATVLRLSLFFFRLFIETWWTVEGPETYTLTKTGENVYVFPDGEVYNPATGKFGTISDDHETVTWHA